MNGTNNFFTEDGHLTDEGIALWIDALAEDRLNELHPDIVEHGEDCMKCKEAIIETSHYLTSETSAQNLTGREVKIRNLFNSQGMIFKLAAVALILIVIGYLLFLFLPLHKDDPSDLFAQHFTPYPDLISAKSTPINTDPASRMFVSGLFYYNDLDFDTASLIFNYLHQRSPSDDTVAFYLANAILASGKQPDSAILLFNRLSISEGTFAEPSFWYLALAYLQNNEPGQAEIILKKIILMRSSYHKQAEVILRDID